MVPLFKQLSESLERIAGIRLHHGKTRVWNAGGIPLEDVLELGRDAWHPHGLKVPRTFVGSRVFTSKKLRDCVAAERQVSNAISHVKDLRCAWQLLLRSANHTLRTLPPSLVEALLQPVPGGQQERQFARALTTFPNEDGRIGDEIGNPLRCRCMLGIGQRNPDVAEVAVRTMEEEQQFPEGGCMAELAAASAQLDREGFWWRPG